MTIATAVDVLLAGAIILLGVAVMYINRTVRSLIETQRLWLMQRGGGGWPPLPRPVPPPPRPPPGPPQGRQTTVHPTAIPAGYG